MAVFRVPSAGNQCWVKIQKFIVYSIARRFSSAETQADQRYTADCSFVQPPYCQCNVARRDLFPAIKKWQTNKVPCGQGQRKL